MCYNKSSNNLKFKNEPMNHNIVINNLVNIYSNNFKETILIILLSICLLLHLTPANQGTLKFKMG